VSFDRRTYAALLSLAAAYFTLGMGSLAVIALVPPMAADLGTSPAAIANLLTVFALTFAFAAPLSQVLLGQFARRTLLLGGLVLMSLASIAGAFAGSYAVLVATRLLMGLGAATVGPMALAVAAGLTSPEQQGRALAVAFGGMMLATVLGIPLSAWLGGLVGWRAVLLGIGLVGLGAAVAVFRRVHDTHAGGRVSLGTLFAVLARRRPGLSVATTLLQMAAQFATYALLLPYLTDRAGVAASWGAVAFFMFGVGGIVGNLAAGRLADRIGADRTVAFSLGGVALTLLGLSVAPPGVVPTFTLLAVWAVTGVMFQAPQQKRLVTIDPAARGLLLSLNSSALYLGMSLGAFLSGVVLRSLGAGALPVGSLLLMVLAAVCFAGSRETARTR
jgi:MFS transporter, DHA1 family, inner membrane transport protein